jgi:hypothetical protein
MASDDIQHAEHELDAFNFEDTFALKHREELS